MGNQPLKEAYPEAFVAAVKPCCSVAETLDWHNQNWCWIWAKVVDAAAPCFQTMADEFMGLVENISLHREVIDTREWVASEDGEFSVSSC